MITNPDHHFFLTKFNDFYEENQCFLKSHLEACEKCSRTLLITLCNSVSRYKLISQSKHFHQWEVTFPYSVYVSWKRGCTGLPLREV